MSAGAPLAEGRIDRARPVLAASVAVFRGERVLLARRTRDPGAGRFSLPGGRVELGEGLEAAALRELREEVGVEARIVAFNGHVEIIEHGPDGTVVAHFVVASFVGEWIAGEGALGPEASELVWACRQDIHTLPTTDGLPSLLERARAADMPERPLAWRS